MPEDSESAIDGTLPAAAKPRAFALLLLPLVAALLAFALWYFISSAPPRQLTIASGPADSSFNQIAEGYRKVLARNGIRLVIRNTEGSPDNLGLMLAPQSPIDIALVQSGTGQFGMASTGGGDRGRAELKSLGTVSYVPLMIFYRGAQPIERLSQLSGKRIAIGATGSGTRALALTLLAANEIVPGAATQLLDQEGQAATAALLAGDVDAIVLSGDSASAAVVRGMLHSPGIRLYDFTQADAYVRRFPYLAKLEVPAGTVDLANNVPATNIALLAGTVELIVHNSLNPALSDLLIEAAGEVNGGATVLQSAGEFPRPLAHDYPLSTDAARYYKSGRTYAFRYLPFWMASLVERAVLVLLPTILLLVPLLRYIPAAYDWFITSRINRRYRELLALERQALGELSPARRAELMERLAQIDRAVILLKVPDSHADQLYLLREHIQFVSDSLLRAQTASAAAPADAGRHPS